LNKLKITQLLILSYLTSLAFAKWWDLPVLGYKFQLPEVVFLLGLILLGLGKINFRWRAFDRLDWGITALITLVAIGALGGDFKESWLGVLGWGYLYAGYLLFSRIEVGDMHARLKLVSQGWMGAAILVSIGGIVGVACWRLGVDNFLVHEKYLPYWGEGARAASFVRHPDVLANLIVYAFIFYTCRHWRDLNLSRFSSTLILVVLFAVALILSFSKFLILIPFVFLLVFMRLHPRRVGGLRLMVFVLAGGSMLLFLLGTHYFLISKSDWQAERSKMDAFITEKVVWEGREVNIVETAYVPLKRVAWQAGWEHLPFGIGMGQFPEFLQQQIADGKAPNIPAYDVHSSYWGLWAESGMLGALGGLIFVYCLFSYLWSWYRREKTREEYVYWIGVTTMLLYVLVEGMVLDGLHFRHHWFLWVMVAWGIDSRAGARGKGAVAAVRLGGS
jgi:hypothetical protein